MISIIAIVSFGGGARIIPQNSPKKQPGPT